MAIYFDYTVTVKDGEAKLNKDIYLYQGNRNIDYYFTIKEAPFKYSKPEGENIIEKLSPSHAAVTLLRTSDNVEVGTGKVEVLKDKIKLTIKKEMIDEKVEVGKYTMVIDLMDDENDSIATLPPIVDQIEIRPRVTSLSFDGSNVVNEAVVDCAIITGSSEPLNVFDDQGNYIKTIWKAGDKIVSEKLNKIEEAIYQTTEKSKSIPTKTSQLVNDSEFIDKKYVDDSQPIVKLVNKDTVNYKQLWTEISSAGTYCLEGLWEMSQEDASDTSVIVTVKDLAPTKLLISWDIYLAAINKTTGEIVDSDSYMLEGEVERTVSRLGFVKDTDVEQKGYATEKYVDDNIIIEPLPVHEVIETSDLKRYIINIMDMNKYGTYGFIKDKNIMSSVRFVYIADDGTKKVIANTGDDINYTPIRVYHYGNSSTLYIGNTYYIVDYSAKATSTDITVTSYLRGYLHVNNTKEYIPTEDYNPATKKYVDDKGSFSFNEQGELVVTINGVTKTFIPKSV